MITKSKTGLAELMHGYTASEIAEFLASEEKLLQEVETASAKKKKEAAQAKCIALKDSIYSEVSRLRGMVQQYLELLHQLQPGQGNDLSGIVDLTAFIKAELKAAGLVWAGRPAHNRTRTLKGQYPFHIQALFAGTQQLTRYDFLNQLAERTGKPASSLKLRYGSKFNRQRDGIEYRGELVTLRQASNAQEGQQS